MPPIAAVDRRSFRGEPRLCDLEAKYFSRGAPR